MNLLTVAEYLCHKRPQICSICRNHNPVLPSFITYHRCCNKSNRTGETSGAGTAYRSEARAFTPGVQNIINHIGTKFLTILIILTLIAVVIAPAIIFMPSFE